jgi:hypothetical protein
MRTVWGVTALHAEVVSPTSSSTNKTQISLARRNLCTSIAVLVGWRTTARMPTELPLDALKMAL